MGNEDDWGLRLYENGYSVIELMSWRFFANQITQLGLNVDPYIFRGQSNAKWPLETCLDRSLRAIGKLEDSLIREKHLKSFKHAVRGRRGPHPREITQENDWWALGQHHSLPTPLLDWTESPYVALFFAFENPESFEGGCRSVYALASKSIEEETEKIKADFENPEEASNVVQIVRPMSDENTRLTSQRGLFTRIPNGITLEFWVKNHMEFEKDEANLIEFLIPNDGREDCLKALNLMNINRLSLFPDIEGAASYCDTKLMIENY